MFDIKDYYSEENPCLDKSSLYYEVGSIEEDLSRDIDLLLKNRFDSLYKKDKFKRKNHGIDIIYPRLAYPGPRSLIRGADHIRFLLSLYPFPSDLDNLQKVVLRPRYVEIAGVELIALYLRKSGILVQYLYHPHFYNVDDSPFRDYAEFKPIDLNDFSRAHLAENSTPRSCPVNPRIPPFWYLISLIGHSRDDRIDKFFLKQEAREDPQTYDTLNEISFFYSRHGY